MADQGSPTDSAHPHQPVDNSMLRPATRAAILQWVAVFVFSFGLYAATSSRGIQWQDSGVRVIRILTGDVVGRLGLALSHPLQYWLGRLAVLPDLLEPAWAVTLTSSLCAAIAVANVFGCVRMLTGRWQAAAFAAASLGLAHIFWQMATLAEVYALTAALLSAEIWCLAAFVRGRQWCLPVMFLFNGLGAANHMFAGLTTPVLLAVAVIASRQGRANYRLIALSAGAWLIGSLPYTALIAAEWHRSGDLAETLRSALFGKVYAGNVLNTGLSLGFLARSVLFLVYDFPNLLLPAAVLGMLSARKAGMSGLLKWVLIAAVLIHAVFVFRYNVPDQQTFFVPLCVLLSIWGGIGAAVVLQWPASTAHVFGVQERGSGTFLPGSPRRAGIAGFCPESPHSSVAGVGKNEPDPGTPNTHSTARTALVSAATVLLVTTPLVYAVAASAARKYEVLDKYPQRPYRDNYTYFFVPWSVVEDSAQRVSEQAMELARPDGVIFFEDSMARAPLEYRRLMSSESQVEVLALPLLDTQSGRERFKELTAADGQARPVVFVPKDVRKVDTEVLPGMHWAGRGDLYVLERTPTGQSDRGAPTVSMR